MTTDMQNPPRAEVASPDAYRMLFSNQHVSVVEMKLEPGVKDNWHHHPRETVYFVTGGRLKIRVPGSEPMVKDVLPGEVMWHEAWVHQVENVGGTTVIAIIVEDMAHPLTAEPHAAESHV